MGAEKNNTGALPAPRIGLYFVSSNRNSYLIARTLSMTGSQIFVRLEKSFEDLMGDPDSPNIAERRYCSWLYSEPRIKVVTNDDSPPQVDVLLFEISSLRPRFRQGLAAWQKQATRVIAWNSNDHESSPWGNLRGELACVKHYWEFMPRVKSVIMGAGRLNLRPTAMVCRAVRQGYFAHPIFFREQPLFREMFEGDCAWQNSRAVRLVFSGNPEPASRRQLIDDVFRSVQGFPGVTLLRHYQEMAERQQTNGGPLALWMVRGDSSDPKWYSRQDVVPPAKWPGVLRQCDFVFCPPGYEKKTHRVIESLLQGVIPILDCPEEYEIGLVDGENCLKVSAGRWKETVEHALGMTSGQVIKMRAAVMEIRNAYLLPEAAGRNWLAKLEVPEMVNGHARAIPVPSKSL
jgi:hypothetical protein